MPLRIHSVARLLVVLLLAARSAAGDPVVVTGDAVLRHDIQLLADNGIIAGPISTWPLAWGPIVESLRDNDAQGHLAPDVTAAMRRLRVRAERETRIHEPGFDVEARVAESPTRIRGYANSPREAAELGAAFSWTGDRLSVMLSGQVVDRQEGDTDFRADGSMIGVAIGNYALSLNTLDRWWGPGWDGSLILSNNARPIPSISLDRTFTDAFANRFLHWIGPWDLSVMMGQLESDREVPDALLFGMRFSFRPLASLEIGLSRTAQWCGKGRPCDAGTFSDLLLGKDNIGDAGIDTDNEPGNQLAGIDVRWSQARWRLPTAIYGQFIGEDEAGGFPSRFLGLLGIEATGLWNDTWSWRWFGEFAGTSCVFYRSGEIANCAYNHSIYRTGYRYRGRSLGHGADNDARVVSSGVTLVDSDAHEWGILLRYGRLNRIGQPDARNTLTPGPEDIGSIDVSHSRALWHGKLGIGVGYERADSDAAGNDGDARFYVQWRSEH